MKKLYYFFAVMTVTLLCCRQVWGGTYSGGDGTEPNAFRIANAADWNELTVTSGDWSAYFVLVNNINLSSLGSLMPVAPDTDPCSAAFNGVPFTGDFNGADHVIYNADINLPSEDIVGLFGCVGSGGTIRNLVVRNLDIRGEDAVGGLVGLNDQGMITDCHTRGTVTGHNGVGGLVGWNDDGMIMDCSANVICDGSWGVGGLVGSNNYVISNCYATGLVTGEMMVGGLVGGIEESGIIGYCYAKGPVRGDSLVGGLLGSTVPTGTLPTGIVDCYATGPVTGDSIVGGLIGGNYIGEIGRCYSTGVVDGNSLVGGLVGENDDTIADCFWDIQTSWMTDGVGNENPDPAGAMGRSTAEMRTLSTFAGEDWDFGTPVWVYYTNGYPRLSWEPTLPIGDLNHDGIVNFRDFSIFSKHWLKIATP